MLLTAEVAVRVVASRLPVPQTWSSPEAQVKYGQLRALARGHQTGGVVFLSTSVLDVGVDPAAFAADTGTRLPVFNASVSGANLEELRWWTTRLVLPLLRPRLVVVGLSSREFNGNDPQAAQLAGQFFAAPAVRHLNGDETLLQRLERYGDQTSDLFRYRKSLRTTRTILHRTTTDLVDLQRRYFTSPQGQELALAGQSYRTSSSLDKLFQSTIVANYHVASSKAAVLAGLLADIQASKAQAVLVDAPVTQAYIDLHPHGSTDYAAYQQALAGVATSTHTPFVPGQVWTTPLFADPLHLNESGAKQLSHVLADRLRTDLGAIQP
jgi:hypothetical protein